MIPTAPRTNAAAALVTLCEDAFFAIAGAAKLDLDQLRALAARRAVALRVAALGTPGPTLAAWDAWVHELCIAIAPIAPPRWLPMGDAVAAGLSLEHGARGVRSLFTSKPSEKDIARVRRLGAFAVRSLGGVLSATGQWTTDARLLRASLIASLGLPEEDQRALDAELPVPTETLELQSGCDAKVARAIVRGAFYAAMGDGMDPREERAVISVAQRVELEADGVNASRQEAREQIDGARAFGEAAVDAVRFLLQDEQAESERLAIAAARLTLPPVHRRDALTAVNVGGPVTLGKKHPVERRHREAVLGLSWAVAIRENPTYTRRNELSVRHDLIAADLGELADGAQIRSSIDRLVEAELSATLLSAATT
jgi:hypothetical protein